MAYKDVETAKQAERLYYEKNRDKILARNAVYREKNWEKVKAKALERERVRLKTDVQFKIKRYLRNRLKEVLKERKCQYTTVGLLGCSVSELKTHLQSMFKPEMSWDNHGEWHIDHIIPPSSFDMRDASEVRKAFHFTNLQTLWAIDNLKKSDKMIYGS
jgi:hypothetical protein